MNHSPFSVTPTDLSLMEDLHTSGDNGGEVITFSDVFDTAPARGGFFYSAPSSPMHCMLSSPYSNIDSSSTSLEGCGGSFEFEFTVRQEAIGTAPADELFLNGQIRPMKLSTHLQRPQVLPPLIDVGNDGEDGGDGEDSSGRGRDLKFQDRSKELRRRTRSLSPLRSNSELQWLEDFESNEINEIKEELEAGDDETPSSGASSRSSSVGRSSKRWVFLKELLNRSKSEGGSSRSNKFWSNLSFSSSGNREKKLAAMERTAVNGVGMNIKRSAHEVHYRRNRAHAEEMRKKTYLPYREGLLLGCLGFSSKSYGAINGLARALNPVSSR